jgi:hypothetical protein
MKPQGQRFLLVVMVAAAMATPAFGQAVAKAAARTVLRRVPHRSRICPAYGGAGSLSNRRHQDRDR